MKSNSRSTKDILKKVATIVYAPFLIIFLILFGVLSTLLCLVYAILAKLCKNLKLPSIFDFLLNDFNDSYYDSYEYQSESKEYDEFMESEESEEFEDCNF